MVKWSVEHKSIVILLTVVTLLSGFLLYGTMERQENPTVASPIATIRCIYGGASPEDIEKLIVKPIENKIGDIAEIKKMESFCMDSVGVIKVTLKDLSDNDIQKIWDDMKDDIDSVEASLPSDAQKPVVETDFTSSYGILLGLTSKDYTYQDLKDVANELKDFLKEDDGVKAIDIFGEVGQQIEISLDMVKLQQYGITPTNIATFLKARNVNIPGGNLEISGTKVPIQISGEYESIDEIKNTIVGVSTKNGTPVYLKNVADVVQKEEKAEKLAEVNNQKALIMGIKYTDGQNMLAIQERLYKEIETFEQTQLYANMEIVKLTDQADFVKSSISLFQDNLISAVILVAVVVLITMGIKSAIVVSLPIPVVIAIVFIYMVLTEIPLHQVSIASLIISLSLLVANGIVANDNINVYLDKGYSKKEACIQGIKEVNIAILTSTLTTVASFLPLAMMQGSAGKFVKSLPILVSVALAGSYLTSLTLVPATGYWLLQPKSQQKKGTLKEKLKKAFHIEKIGQSILTIYAKLLRIALKIPRLLILVFIIIFVLSGLLVPSMGIQIFPPAERDQYALNVMVQDGSSMEHTKEVMEEIGKYLEKDSSIDNYSVMIGDGYPKYYVTFTPNQLDTAKAQFLINGKLSDINRIEKELNENIPGVVVNAKELEIGIPVTYPIEIRISGPEIEVLRKIGDDVKNMVYQVEGGKNAEDDYGYSSNKLKVKVNEEKSNIVGVSNYDVATTVRMAVNGIEVSELKQKDIDEDPYPIHIKIPDNDKTKREVLNDIYITSQVTGQNVPLPQIADIITESSMNKIVRRDEKRTLTVGLFVEDGYNTQTVMTNCQEALKDYEIPEGYSIVFGGESEENRDTFSSLVIPTLIAIVGIYLILVLEFGDIRQPLIIMGTIPLSFIGILWGLKLLNYPIGFMALLGAISLMGVVVNNGIVLLDYINTLIKDYDNPVDAIVEACKTRLRPIMIGMITTVISLIPLALTGGLLWAPLATSIVYGMLLSSVLTMFVIPSAYYVSAAKKMKKQKEKACAKL